MELTHEASTAKGGHGFASIIYPNCHFGCGLSLDSVITAVGLTTTVNIIAGHSLLRGDSSSQNPSEISFSSIRASKPRFGLFDRDRSDHLLEGIGKEVEKELIYVPMICLGY